MASNTRGIGLEDATLLIVAIFCTLDVLPPELRNAKLGRNELSDVFSHLANARLIHDASADARMPVFWNSVINQFLSGTVKLPDHYAQRAEALTGG